MQVSNQYLDRTPFAGCVDTMHCQATCRYVARGSRLGGWSALTLLHISLVMHKVVLLGRKFFRPENRGYLLQSCRPFCNTWEVLELRDAVGFICALPCALVVISVHQRLRSECSAGMPELSACDVAVRLACPKTDSGRLGVNESYM